MEKITRTINAEYLPEVEYAIKKLAKRAAKLGVPAPTMTASAPRRVERRDEITNLSSVFFLADVEVSNVAVKLPGWSLIAALDHSEKTVRVVPDADLPAHYRGAESFCDHCKTKRTRNTTYILRHEDGRFVQSGSDCIKDFLGHDAARAVLVGEFAITIGEILDEPLTGMVGSRSQRLIDLLHYLVQTIRVVAVNGFLSRTAVKQAGDGRQSTADEVLWVMDPPNDKDREYIRKHYPEATEAQAEKAQAVIDWALSLSDADCASDYLYNVRQIAQNGFVTVRSVGTAASMPKAYDRAQGDAAERANRKEITSVHFGTVGERGVYTLTLFKVVDIESFYGMTRLHIFRDQDGNAAKWFSSSGQIAEIGETITVKATVKAHDTFKGVAQTSLGRVAIFTPKEKKPRAPRKPKAAAQAEPVAVAV